MIEWDVGPRSFRLHVQRLEDGWAWSSWDERGKFGWFALAPPLPENTRRRFRTQQQVEDFFCMLAELLLDLPDVTGFPVRARPNTLSWSVRGGSDGA